MNDTPPLTADQIDELLSAELDGEFDAAARDLGLDPAEARDRLVAEVPGLAARRAALGAGRDLLAELPAVDEMVAARVRAKAVKTAAAEHEIGQASRAHRLRRVTAIAGGLAAAIAVIAGLAFTAQHTGGSTSKSSAAAPDENARASTPRAAAAAPTAGGVGAVDLGAVGDVPALVARARSQTSHGADAATPAPESQKSARVATGSPGDRTTDELACERVADQVSGVSSPALRGVATLSGTAVQVYVFRDGGNDIVVVLRTDCRLVTTQTLPASSG